MAARLLAMLLLAVCITATLQTGEWRGPADLASVGEGHSMPPDRRLDAFLDQLAADDDGACLCGASCYGDGDVVQLAAVTPLRAVPSSRTRHRPGAPRGPPSV
jgi:hypothetical protein